MLQYTRSDEWRGRWASKFVGMYFRGLLPILQTIPVWEKTHIAVYPAFRPPAVLTQKTQHQLLFQALEVSLPSSFPARSLINWSQGLAFLQRAKASLHDLSALFTNFVNGLTKFRLDV